MRKGKIVAFDAPKDFRIRAAHMLVAFFTSPSDEFEISAGFIDDVRYVVVKIDDQRYPFNLEEAAEVARSLEQTMKELPTTQTTMTVADLIMGIRHAAVEIERIEPEEIKV